MTLGNPLPWWFVITLVVLVLCAAYMAYASPAAPTSGRLRGGLRLLRSAAFLLVIALWLRPLLYDHGGRARGAVVPILVDTSRSMAIADAGGASRLDRARTIVSGRLLPMLGQEFEVELLQFGETVAGARVPELLASGARSDITGALAAVERRYAGRAIAGVVVVSDGAETGADDLTRPDPLKVPVYAIGVGGEGLMRDREVLSVMAGRPSVVDSIVDLSASVVSRGFGRQSMTVTLQENGRPIHVRKVTPDAEGSPVALVFRVTPSRDAATDYAVTIDPDDSEVTTANNVRHTLVGPAGRRRRVLLVEGGPGFEHSFLKRALDADPGLEVDAVVRKGQNERGLDTFYVQAAESRAVTLLDGYPVAREALYAYDGLIFANLGSDVFSHDQLAATADFVLVRGGGLLVLGARSFDHEAWLRTPVEDVLPLDLIDRTGRTPEGAAPSVQPRWHLIPTAEGVEHPILRMGESVDETLKRWSAAPALAATASLGVRRPAASVLAEAIGPGDPARPLVAIQRCGEGRSMIFAGEASWRWKMQRPSGDQLYDMFWRQAVRWLVSASPAPIVLEVPIASAPGDSLRISVKARDEAFRPVKDAEVVLTVRDPDGTVRQIPTEPDEAQPGRYVGHVQTASSGTYRVRATCLRGRKSLGSAEQTALVGGADEEMADPRRNDEVLRRIAVASGGSLVADHDLDSIRDSLGRRAPEPAPPAPRDIGQSTWAFVLIVAVLSTEWTLRRRWGMR